MSAEVNLFSLILNPQKIEHFEKASMLKKKNNYFKLGKFNFKLDESRSRVDEEIDAFLSTFSPVMKIHKT